MFKAFNNHFIDRFKIKIQKIRPLYNVKSAKIAKKMWKNIFSINFGRYDMHEIFKKLDQMKEVKRIYFPYIFLFFKNATSSKIYAE